MPAVEKLTWDHIQAIVNEATTETYVDPFRAAVGRFFADTPRITHRRPNLACRLRQGEWTFVCKPFTHRRSLGYRDDKGRIVYEVTVDPQSITVEGVDDNKRCGLAVQLHATRLPKVKCARWSYLRGQQAIEDFVALVAEFPRNPESVFARSPTHCCLCAKRLTDGISRSRGIGPECYGAIQSLFNYVAKGGNHD